MVTVLKKHMIQGSHMDFEVEILSIFKKIFINLFAGQSGFEPHNANIVSHLWPIPTLIPTPLIAPTTLNLIRHYSEMRRYGDRNLPHSRFKEHDEDQFQQGNLALATGSPFFIQRQKTNVNLLSMVLRSKGRCLNFLFHIFPFIFIMHTFINIHPFLYFSFIS